MDASTLIELVLRGKDPTVLLENECEPLSSDMWEITSIDDTREYDWETGKPIPGTGIQATCERCKRTHDVLYHMQNEKTGERKTVGSGCGPQMAGGIEHINRSSLKKAEKNLEKLKFSQKKEQIRKWVDELAPRVGEAQPPGKIVPAVVFNAPGFATEDGLLKRRIIGSSENDISLAKHAIWNNAAHREALKIADQIPERWLDKVPLYPRQEVASYLTSKILKYWLEHNAEYRALDDLVHGH